VRERTASIAILGAVIGGTAMVIAGAGTDFGHHAALSCRPDPIATSAGDYRSLALAELRAIVRWRQISDTSEPGYSNWHNADERSIRCKRIGNGGFHRCNVRAVPCRLKTAAAS